MWGDSLCYFVALPSRLVHWVRESEKIGQGGETDLFEQHHTSCCRTLLFLPKKRKTNRTTTNCTIVRHNHTFCKQQTPTKKKHIHTHAHTHAHTHNWSNNRNPKSRRSKANVSKRKTNAKQFKKVTTHKKTIQKKWRQTKQAAAAAGAANHRSCSSIVVSDLHDSLSLQIYYKVGSQ